MPVVVRRGATTLLTVGPGAPPALTGRIDGMKVLVNVGGKWNVPSVSTVRDDRGAWLLLK